MNENVLIRKMVHITVSNGHATQIVYLCISCVNYVRLQSLLHTYRQAGMWAENEQQRRHPALKCRLRWIFIDINYVQFFISIIDFDAFLLLSFFFSFFITLCPFMCVSASASAYICYCLVFVIFCPVRINSHIQRVLLWCLKRERAKKHQEKFRFG